MNLLDIRKKITSEEFDYLTLTDIFKNYSNPKMKISEMLKKQYIIRVKKGLYIFNEKYRNHPYSKELLANLIYGPSIVSAEYMLSYYGIIPEKVLDMTCSTIKRNKDFITPIGTFSYMQVPQDYYSNGITIIKNEYVSFLAATKERALADKIKNDTMNILNNYNDVENYLFNDLRVDEDMFFCMDAKILESLAVYGKSRKINMCMKFLKRGQRQ